MKSFKVAVTNRESHNQVLADLKRLGYTEKKGPFTAWKAQGPQFLFAHEDGSIKWSVKPATFTKRTVDALDAYQVSQLQPERKNTVATSAGNATVNPASVTIGGVTLTYNDLNALLDALDVA